MLWAAGEGAEAAWAEALAPRSSAAGGFAPARRVRRWPGGQVASVRRSKEASDALAIATPPREVRQSAPWPRGQPPPKPRLGWRSICLRRRAARGGCAGGTSLAAQRHLTPLLPAHTHTKTHIRPQTQTQKQIQTQTDGANESGTLLTEEEEVRGSNGCMLRAPNERTHHLQCRVSN